MDYCFPQTDAKSRADDINTVLQTCPDTKLVISGYSQGGQLVHNAAALLPAETMAKVNSVVIFGDPDDGQPIAGVSAAKTMVVCHSDDDICQHGDLILLGHLTYAQDVDQAAAFVVSSV